jgi:hypothetical protein
VLVDKHGGVLFPPGKPDGVVHPTVAEVQSTAMCSDTFRAKNQHIQLFASEPHFGAQLVVESLWQTFAAIWFRPRIPSLWEIGL